MNQGLLDRAKFEPAVRKAGRRWSAAWMPMANSRTSSRSARTRKNFAEDSTEVYGVGAFLLAGSEVYRMAVLEKRQSASAELIKSYVAIRQISGAIVKRLNFTIGNSIQMHPASRNMPQQLRCHGWCFFAHFGFASLYSPIKPEANLRRQIAFPS